MRQVTGIDISFSNTGLATFREDGTRPIFDTAATPTSTDTPEAWSDRINLAAGRIYTRAIMLIQPGDEVLFVIEGPSIGSVFGNPDERAGLRWRVIMALRPHGRIVIIPPATNKKFWTGNGSAKKKKMVEFANYRYPEFNLRDDNLADALALATAGAQHLGFILSARAPATDLTALDKVQWPA